MSDTDFLASALEDGNWHSHNEILERSFSDRGYGLTVHSRAADLRKRGHVVETRLERDRRGRTLSFYRLLGEADGAGLSASPSTPSNPERGGLVSSLSAPPSHADDPAGIRDGDVLELFTCVIDESAGLREETR